MSRSATLLVADDDPVARDLLAEVLTREGYTVHCAEGGEECLRVAERVPLDLALIDLRMPDLDGLGVLKRLAAIRPGVPVLILTAFATMETAIDAIRAGAYDYLSKPFRMDEIALVVRRTLDAQRLARENEHYRRALQERYAVTNLVGISPAMVAIYKLVARVAALDTTVLILGETGTGKEMVARTIHYASPRAQHPFVVVDCTALPESLFESELFGHERGAFTGAITARRGLLETAEGGTCLLDEVGELSAPLQAKLLRVLETREVTPLGATRAQTVDLSVCAATLRDLGEAVAAGRFREDLYYRLNVVSVTMPPLRERAGDIPLLAQHFLTKYASSTGKPVTGLAPAALARLERHHWPGNVRELEHAIERAVALASTTVLLSEDLPAEVDQAAASPTSAAADRPEPPRGLTLEALKQWYIQHVLEETAGNKARAAEILGIDRRTLYRMLERQPDDEEAEP